jgi:hypothetical protein
MLPALEVISELFRYTIPVAVKLTFPEALRFPEGSMFVAAVIVIAPADEVTAPAP